MVCTCKSNSPTKRRESHELLKYSTAERKHFAKPKRRSKTKASFQPSQSHTVTRFCQVHAQFSYHYSAYRVNSSRRIMSLNDGLYLLGSLSLGSLYLRWCKWRLGCLLLGRIIRWAAWNDNVELLVIEMLSPDQAGTILSRALVDNSIWVLSNGLDLDMVRLRVL